MPESTKPSGWPITTLRRLIEKQQALAQECAEFLKELENAPEWIPLSDEEVLHIKLHNRIPVSDEARLREQASEASAKIPTSDSGSPAGPVRLPPVSQFLNLQSQSEEGLADVACPDGTTPNLQPGHDNILGGPEQLTGHREKLRRLFQGPPRPRQTNVSESSTPREPEEK